MSKDRDLIAVAEEAVRESRVFENADPTLFPKPPKDQSESVRLQMREEANSNLFFFAKVVLGYSKLRVEPHGELCSFIDFLDNSFEQGDFRFNRSIIYMPRDTYKTTIATIARNIRRGCKNPDVRILIIADTALNASRFGIEIRNHFEFNTLLQWLYPEVIPENFHSVRWSSKELVLRRSSPWREPTFDMMGSGSGVESRHYDHIAADDLVTQTHLDSETEMENLIEFIPSLEPLLISDVEGTIDFVGSRKRKDDAYEFVEKLFGAKDAVPVKIGPHAELRGELTIYSRQIRENGKNIFPYRRDLKSGISDQYLQRLQRHDPERYHAQYMNSPKGVGISTFDTADLRFFTLSPGGMIEAVHDGKLVERISVWELERILLYDPSVAERQRSSKNAVHIVGKGSGPNRYVLFSHIAHTPPDEMMELLFQLDEEWRPTIFSIEKRGFQGWVKYSLDMLSDLQGKPYLPIVEFPPEGAAISQRSKPEHIRALQPLVRNHLIWLQADQHDLLEEFEFYPNVKWDDGLDSLAQGLVYWPFSIDEGERAARRQSEAEFLRSATGASPDSDPNLLGGGASKQQAWSEADFLSRFDATGYGFR